MAQIIKIKNNTVDDGVWNGQTIVAGEYIDVSLNSHEWHDSDILASITAGDLVVNNGTADITDTVQAWNWILGDTMPISGTIDGTKIAVHNSSKPEPAGVTTFAVWTGAGDNMDEPDETLSIGSGDLLTFNMSYDAGGPHVEYKDVKFDPRHGRVWIHEAYLKFADGGVPDYMKVETMAPASSLQQAVNLDLVVDGENYVSYAPGGPGTGTHGFAATPFLLPRPYAKDGSWDYINGNLLPNMDGTGGYKISTQEQVVHRFFNKLPMHGTSSTYFTMTSDETSELPAGYFIRISCHNESNSDWTASCIMEIFRERTAAP